MLKDLLKGKCRDITPKSRTCCFDGATADLVIKFNDFFFNMFVADTPDKSKMEYNKADVLACLEKLKAGRAVSALVLACGVYDEEEYNGVYHASGIYSEGFTPLRCVVYSGKYYVNFDFNDAGDLVDVTRTNL